MYDFRQQAHQLGQSCSRNFDTAAKTFKILIGNEFCITSILHHKWNDEKLCLFICVCEHTTYRTAPQIACTGDSVKHLWPQIVISLMLLSIEIIQAYKIQEQFCNAVLCAIKIV